MKATYFVRGCPEPLVLHFKGLCPCFRVSPVPQDGHITPAKPLGPQALGGRRGRQCYLQKSLKSLFYPSSAPLPLQPPPLSPAGPHPTQKTGITLTTNRMMGMVMMMRPHTTTMATPYSGKPGAGGGSRVSSGGGTELLALLIWVCCSHTPKGSSLTSYGNGVWIHLEV